MGRREENAIMVRKNLINTADQLIVQCGYENVSVDDIVKASGIAKGTFYNYFKRKEDLIFELSKERFAHVTGDVDKLAEDDPLTSIRRYLINFMTVIVNSKIELVRQWIRYVSASSSNNQSKWQFDVSSLERLLQKLIAAHKLSADTPTPELARLLLTEMYGVILTWSISPDTVDPIVTVNEFCDLQLETLLHRYLSKD